MSSERIIENRQVIEKKGKNLDLEIDNIVNLVQIAAGNITGIPKLIIDLPGQIKLQCSSDSGISNFKKMELSKDGKNLLGILLLGGYTEIKKGFWIFTYSEYKIKLSFWFFNVKISNDNNKDALTNEFQEHFNYAINNVNEVFTNAQNLRSFGCWTGGQLDYEDNSKINYNCGVIERQIKDGAKR